LRSQPCRPVSLTEAAFSENEAEAVSVNLN
jgi:hypothetical protein